MPKTYEPIATNTLGSATSSVTLSSIPSTYTDLVLVVMATNTGGATDIFLTINGDTGTNYSYTWITTNASTVTSGRVSSTANLRNGYYGIPGSTFGYLAVTHLLNYSNTTTNKTLITRSGNASTGGGTDAIVALWRSTSAINSLQLRASTGTFGSGSTFTVYGIKAA